MLSIQILSQSGNHAILAQEQGIEAHDLVDDLFLHPPTPQTIRHPAGIEWTHEERERSTHTTPSAGQRFDS